MSRRPAPSRCPSPPAGWSAKPGPARFRSRPAGWSPRQCVKKVPQTICETVTEQRVKCVPMTVCEMQKVTCTRKVPYTTCSQVVDSRDRLRTRYGPASGRRDQDRLRPPDDLQAGPGRSLREGPRPRHLPGGPAVVAERGGLVAVGPADDHPARLRRLRRQAPVLQERPRPVPLRTTAGATRTIQPTPRFRTNPSAPPERRPSTGGSPAPGGCFVSKPPTPGSAQGQFGDQPFEPGAKLSERSRTMAELMLDERA